MATLSQSQKAGWDARMERIRTGRTMKQCAEAEGTVPMQLKKHSGKVTIGMSGPMAWAMGGVLGWMSATAVTTISPATQLLEKHDMKQLAAPIADYGDPVVACMCFMMAMSFLRVNGFFAKLIGFTVMAWLFAAQVGVEVPLVAELIELGRGLTAGEETFASALMTLQDMAAGVFA